MCPSFPFIERLFQRSQNTPIALGPTWQDESLLRPSAVLVPFVLQPNTQVWEILLTVKQTHLTHHAGQVCCPGGRFDPNLDENLTETALRECEEETGIDGTQIHRVTQIGHIDTTTGFRMHGFVGLIPEPKLPLQLDLAELSDYFFVPTDVALATDQYTKQSITLNQVTFETYRFDYAGYRIWGATARLLYQLALLSSETHT